MATSKVRRLEREAKESIQETREAAKALRTRVRQLEADLAEERDRRIAAQRGLVAYMKEHGLGDRIGYDPDRDPQVWEFEHSHQHRPWWQRWRRPT